MSVTCYHQERTTQYTMSRHKMEESAGFAFEASHFFRFWAKLVLKEMLYVNNMVNVVGNTLTYTLAEITVSMLIKFSHFMLVHSAHIMYTEQYLKIPHHSLYPSVPAKSIYRVLFAETFMQLCVVCKLSRFVGSSCT